MSLEKMTEDVLAVVQAEVDRQVNEGQHKLNAKHKAASHTIDRLRAKLKGAREEFDAMKRRARDAEARVKLIEKEVAELRPKPELAEEPEAPPEVDPMSVLAGVVASQKGEPKL
jgi:predicted  nucleic acid-binding Zn-ribbon protein